VFGNLPGLRQHRKDLQQGQEVQEDPRHTNADTEDAGVLTGAGVGVVGVMIGVFASQASAAGSSMGEL
jgi:hypothetical protein